MFSVLAASFAKELRLLLRNAHALLVLFVMPLVFVLIMSLALQDKIAGKVSVSLPGAMNIVTPSESASVYASAFFANEYIREASESDDEALFTLTLTAEFDEVVNDAFDGKPAVIIAFSPRFTVREQSLVLAAAKESFARVNVAAIADEMGFDEEYVESSLIKEGAVAIQQEPVDEVVGVGGSRTNDSIVISSTQQNVPAWLVFAMFFISLPIANIVLYEQKQKTLMRLRTMGVSTSLWLIAKLLPYLLINMVQFVFLLAVGVWLVPAFGGVALALNVPWEALVAVALCVSIAALGIASLIACLSKTTEQATILAGTCNILFGAIGGVMIPKFVMPDVMQIMTYFSPMGWGLEGFVRVLAFGDSLNAIYTEMLVLIAVGCVSLLIASTVLKRRRL